MERRKKRQKVVTRYLSVHIPSFPLPQADDLRRRFALSEEARMASSDPKKAFVRLTHMIVVEQKECISKVYRADGPFAFIAKACLATLDLFEEKLVAKCDDNAIIKFDSFSKKLPRELELADAVKFIKEQHSNVSLEVAKLQEFKEKVEGGSHMTAVYDKICPLPQLKSEESKFVEEELTQNKNLKKRYDKFSEMVLEKLTVNLTQRWLQYKKVMNQRQGQLRMRKVYDREITNAVLPTVDSILSSIRSVTLL